MRLIWKQLPLTPRSTSSSSTNPLVRSSNNLVVIKDKAYVFGGEGKPREPVDDELWEVDMRDGSTNPIASTTKPSARVGSALTTSTNSSTSSIYLYGGRESKEMSPCDSDIWTIDPTSTSTSSANEGWKRFKTTQGEVEGKEGGSGTAECGVERKSYHVLAQLGGRVYLHAGCPAEGRSNKLDSLELPPSTAAASRDSARVLKWTSHPDAPGAGRGGTVLCPLTLSIPSSNNGSEEEEQILIRYGGFAGHEIGSTLDIFTPRSNEWVEIGLPRREGEAGHPQARSVHGLVPLVPALDIPVAHGGQGGQEGEEGGKVVALMLFGERGPAPAHLGHSGAGQFHRDAWAVVCKSSLVTGTNRWGLGFERLVQSGGEVGGEAPSASASATGEAWEKEVDLEGIPQARGWFAVAPWAGGKVVVHGGLNDQNQRLGDCWVGQVVV